MSLPIALQEQIDSLVNFAPTNGERSDATDHCLAGIARLSHEVQDASVYLPAYDQRTYTDVCKLSLFCHGADRAAVLTSARLSKRFKKSSPRPKPPLPPAKGLRSRPPARIPQPSPSTTPPNLPPNAVVIPPAMAAPALSQASLPPPRRQPTSAPLPAQTT